LLQNNVRILFRIRVHERLYYLSVSVSCSSSQSQILLFHMIKDMRNGSE